MWVRERRTWWSHALFSTLHPRLSRVQLARYSFFDNGIEYRLRAIWGALNKLNWTLLPWEGVFGLVSHKSRVESSKHISWVQSPSWSNAQHSDKSDASGGQRLSLPSHYFIVNWCRLRVKYRCRLKNQTVSQFVMSSSFIYKFTSHKRTSYFDFLTKSSKVKWLIACCLVQSISAQNLHERRTRLIFIKYKMIWST